MTEGVLAALRPDHELKRLGQHLTVGMGSTPAYSQRVRRSRYANKAGTPRYLSQAESQLMLESETKELFDEMGDIKLVVLAETGVDFEEYAATEKSQPTRLPRHNLNASIRFDLETTLLQDDLRLDQVVAVSGQPLASYACSPLDYISRTWPRLWKPTLSKEFARRRLALAEGFSAPDDAVCPFLEFSDVLGHTGCIHVNIVDGDMLVCVGAQIRLDVMIDLVQMLCWLGIVFSKVSEDAPLRLGRSKLEFAYLDDTSTLDIDFETLSFAPEGLSARSCWTAALRGFSLAQNFPVPPRSHGVGLEISLPLLAEICGADRAVAFGGGVVLKGFSSMLAPKSIQDGIVQWHLVCSEEPSSRLPYADGVSRCAGRLMDHQASVKVLLGSRAVLGWWGESELLLHGPSISESYATFSATEWAKSYGGISEVSIGIQQIVAAGVKIALTSRYAKFHFPRSGPYNNILRCASRTPILLYDASPQGKRGWMLPATTALLLIAHQRICEGPWLRPDCFRNELPRSDEAASQFLQDFGATKLAEDYELQDMVRGIWSILEQLMDSQLCHQRDSAGEVALRGRLVGFEYRAVVQERSPLRLKRTKLLQTSGGWPALVRDVDALVLIGHGFGELIRPLCTNGMLCRSWGSLCPGKDFLAVPTALLLDIYEVSGTGSTDAYLSHSKLRWERGGALLFEPCAGGEAEGAHCPCYRIQQIKRGNVRHLGRSSDLLSSASPSAVVIFGSPCKEYRDADVSVLSRITPRFRRRFDFRNLFHSTGRLGRLFKLGIRGSNSSAPPTAIEMNDFGGRQAPSHEERTA